MNTIVFPVVCIAFWASCAMAQQPSRTPRIHGPQGDSTEAVQLQPEDIVLRPIPAALGKPGISSRILVGAPQEPGLYLVRVSLAPHTVNSAHTHPDGRVTTVLSGSLLYGLGAEVDPAKARRFAAGSVYYTPADTPHFQITTDEAVVYEESGVGPSKTVPLRPAKQ